MSITAKGRKWEILHSLWIGWTFTLFFYSVAFIYIGFRTDERKWILWGLGYFVPFVTFIASLFIWGPYSWQSDATGFPTLLLGLVSIIHALKVRREYLLRLESLFQGIGGSSITAKGKRWERLHSLWIGWTFTFGFFNWIAFLYVGFRTKQRKWIVWGILYSVPFILNLMFSETDRYEGAFGDLLVTMLLILALASFVHAFVIRKEYLMRLAALQDQKVYDDAALKHRLAAEYGTSLSENNTAQATPEHESPLEITSTKKERTPLASTASQSEKASVKQSQTTVMPATKPIVAPDILSRDELEYRISSAYPFPLAFGFRSLASIVDPRDLYREQLRVAENMLAFIGSVALSLLREQDREEAAVDPKEFWLTGISPGDWKEIIARCSKVFARYEDSLLALDLKKLNIRSEKKGFGADVGQERLQARPWPGSFRGYSQCF